MRLLLALLLVVSPALAIAALETEEVVFEDLAELGTRSKPTVKINTAKEALDFIVADNIVRQAIENAREQGYGEFVAQAKKLGYDGDEPIFEVRVSSMDKIPPYGCIYRFDSVGNDRRDKPWTKCQYE